MNDVEQFVRELPGRPADFAYYGDYPDFERWRYLPFVGQHRDSDTLTRSNYEVITEDLTKRFPDSVIVEGSSHWAVGWVDEVRVDTHDADAVAAAYEWYERLEQYPVADEEHFTELEIEEGEYDEEEEA